MVSVTSFCRFDKILKVFSKFLGLFSTWHNLKQIFELF